MSCLMCTRATTMPELDTQGALTPCGTVSTHSVLSYTLASVAWSSAAVLSLSRLVTVVMLCKRLRDAAGFPPPPWSLWTWPRFEWDAPSDTSLMRLSGLHMPARHAIVSDEYWVNAPLIGRHMCLAVCVKSRAHVVCC